MIEQPDEAPLESELLEAARAWREPPPPPRDELWREIARRRQARRAARPVWRRLGFPLGIAALIALGIGLGRWTAPHGTTETAPAPVLAGAQTPNNRSITTAANEHLTRTEAFLTEFRASVRGAAGPERFAATSRDLLLETRLLLDAPALQDTRVLGLLQDLELILVQIAQLQTEHRSGDVEMITDGLNQRDVLPRLRTAIPAGQALRHPGGES
jgi:hypothetical protein